jgi:hypothetical protein
MSKDELLLFFSTLGEGAKRIGGIHDNFGVGAKIASLPWNPEGVVVISYKDGKGSMIQIELDPDTADYQLIETGTNLRRQRLVFGIGVTTIEIRRADDIAPGLSTQPDPDRHLHLPHGY